MINTLPFIFPSPSPSLTDLDLPRLPRFSPIPGVRELKFSFCYDNDSFLVWYRHDIYRLFRASLTDHKDVHSRLMSNYKEVPGWWYAVVGLISFVLAVVTIEAFPTDVRINCSFPP
jgi:hypothetical protein